MAEKLALAFGIASLLCSMSVVVCEHFLLISYKLAIAGYCMGIVLALVCWYFIGRMERA